MNKFSISFQIFDTLKSISWFQWTISGHWGCGNQSLPQASFKQPLLFFFSSFLICCNEIYLSRVCEFKLENLFLQIHHQYFSCAATEKIDQCEFTEIVNSFKTVEVFFQPLFPEIGWRALFLSSRPYCQSKWGGLSLFGKSSSAYS